MFETLSRGTRQYAFNAMKGNIQFAEDGQGAVMQAAVQAFDFSYTETKVTSINKELLGPKKCTS
jgi:hypothetical protein